MLTILRGCSLCLPSDCTGHRGHVHAATHISNGAPTACVYTTAVIESQQLHFGRRRLAKARHVWSEVVCKLARQRKDPAMWPLPRQQFALLRNRLRWVHGAALWLHPQ